MLNLKEDGSKPEIEEFLKMVACCNLIFRLYVQLDFLKLGLEGIALYLEEKKFTWNISHDSSLMIISLDFLFL